MSSVGFCASNRTLATGGKVAVAAPTEAVVETELATALAVDLDAAFERYVIAYRGCVVSFVARMLKNDALAEDVAQDVFIRAYRALQSYSPERRRTLRLRSWTYAIAHNLTRNAVRDAPRSVALDPDRPDRAAAEIEAPPGPELLALRDETWSTIRAAVDELSPRLRPAYVMRYLDDLSYDEIAHVLRQPVGRLKRRHIVGRWRCGHFWSSMMMIDKPPLRRLGAEFTTSIFMQIGVDRYSVTDSEIGPVCVGWTARGVSAIRPAGSPEAETEFVRWYLGRIGRRVVRAIELDPIALAAQARVRDARAPDVPLDLRSATPLERRVLAQVTLIPAGYARPGELIARELGENVEPDSVAQALADNPFPLIVPCHRVVGQQSCCRSGYVLGARVQAQLLAAEGLDAAAVDRVTQRGFRYIENDGWFCLPTCGDIARRIDAPGYLGLPSLSDVHERRLRPCLQCRPLAA